MIKVIDFNEIILVYLSGPSLITAFKSIELSLWRQKKLTEGEVINSKHDKWRKRKTNIHVSILGASLVGQMVKNLSAMQETQVWFLVWEDPLKKGMATHDSILTWRTPWIEEPAGLQSTGWQIVGHDWVTELNWTDTNIWSRKWQPTEVFLSGKFHEQRSLVDYNPWGHKESVWATEHAYWYIYIPLENCRRAIILKREHLTSDLDFSLYL